MDKKKVIKLIGNVEKYLLAYEKSGKVSDFSMALQQLHEAEDELSKPDWISVKDELPPYGENVWTRIIGLGYTRYDKSARYETKNKHIVLEYDKNDFEVLSRLQHVTHWRKIDKLEV